MKVVVLGSGVIGVTTAWYLAQAGHEVTVIDRQLEQRWRPVLQMPDRSLTAMLHLGQRRGAT